MIVNGFWFGELGEVQQKCIDSWENNGYEFKLWDESNCDWIVSTDEYFTYKHGHSKGTPVAFSNLFRAELLFQQGGLYVDLDMLCLKPYEFNKRLTPLVEQYGHKDYVLPKEYFCPIDWQSYEDIFTYDGDAYGLHLYNSIWSKEDYERF